MATGWAMPYPPKSTLNIPRREWSQLAPGVTPDPPQAAAAASIAAAEPMYWAPKAGPPRPNPNNPLRRLPARTVPVGHLEPAQKLQFAGRDGNKENADKQRARLGWGVSAPTVAPLKATQKATQKVPQPSQPAKPLGAKGKPPKAKSAKLRAKGAKRVVAGDGERLAC